MTAGWRSFTNSSARPQAEYYRAQATYQAGQKTNALTLFTNFVAQFPTNDFAPLAQLWVADYYYRRGRLGRGGAQLQVALPEHELAALRADLSRRN